MISATCAPTSAGVAPYPASISAVTGTCANRTIRAVAATTSAQGANSPSGYPNAQATPPLVVASASNPAATKSRALNASHTFGSNGRGAVPCKKRVRHLCLLSSVHINLAVVAGSVAPELATVKQY